jgi:hypothetical protein
MKTSNYLLVGIFTLLTAFSLQANAQSTDAFTGKWDVLVEGTPSGDSNLVVELERKDGKLSGTVVRDGAAPAKINRVEEKAKSITIYFNSSGYDVYLFMEKKGDNKAEGSLMDMFDATATRVSDSVAATAAATQSTDKFAGRWDVLVEGTPSGDSNLVVDLERKDGKLSGTVVRDGAAPAKINRVEEKAKSITIYFNSSGYDVYLFMEKKGDNKAEGSLMDMFDATATRK